MGDHPDTFENTQKIAEFTLRNVGLVVSRNRMQIMKRLNKSTFYMVQSRYYAQGYSFRQMYKFTPFLGLQQGALPTYCDDSLSPPLRRMSSHQDFL